LIIPAYRQQVELLLDVLPFIKQEDCFALKGGTAINLFVRDMPRLSIDIDLCYLPIESRDAFLSNLTSVMLRLAERLEANHFKVTKKYTKQAQQIVKLIVSNSKVDVKIEPNMVLRGAVFGIEECTLQQSVQDAFLQSQNANVLSIADLYAGKICAALDRHILETYLISSCCLKMKALLMRSGKLLLSILPVAQDR